MLNLLTKTKPWMVASLLVATAVFGQDASSKSNSNASRPAAKSCAKPDCAPAKKDCQPCPQPCPPTQMCPVPCNPCCPPWPMPVLNAAYSYPARTTTRCPWDISFDASFTYWEPIQDNMEFVATTPVTPPAGSTFTSTVETVNPSFKPGFKIGFGVGFDYDNWDLRGEYTWFRGTLSQSVSAGATEHLRAMMLFPPSDHVDHNFATASQSWKLHMDIADLDFGRWGYVGTKFTFRPSLGLRGTWIRQNLDVDYVEAASVHPTLLEGKSHSWAVGPKFEVDTNWVLGCGFRVYGNVESDLSYTRYTKVNLKEVTSGVLTFSSEQTSIGTLRAHSSLELGLGYGTYWDCNNWYTDLAVGYQFQGFFDQNMFRFYSDDHHDVKSFSPNGNLYMQGLNLTFRLDF